VALTKDGDYNANDEDTVDNETSENSFAATIAATTVNDSNNDDDDDDDDNDHPSNKMSHSKKKSTSTPVKIIFSTRLNNVVIDETLEVTTVLQRTFGELKEKVVSKRLTGKPPSLALHFVYGGRILTDDMLVEDIFQDDDDDEEDDDNEQNDELDFPTTKTRTVLLNIIPPIDDRFVVDLAPKLLSQDDLNDSSMMMMKKKYNYAAATTTFVAADDVDESKVLSTEELLDAYFLNQALLAYNTQCLIDPTIEPPSPMLLFQIQEQAKRLKEDFQSQIPATVWEDCVMKPIQKIDRDQSKAQWKGQRYRSGDGGLLVQFKKSLQTNVNVVRYAGKRERESDI
jgi:hypothetical protein